MYTVSVVYVGMGLDFHQTFSRQILRAKGCVAFAGWFYAATNQITDMIKKRSPKQYNKESSYIF